MHRTQTLHEAEREGHLSESQMRVADRASATVAGATVTASADRHGRMTIRLERGSRWAQWREPDGPAWSVEQVNQAIANLRHFVGIA